MPLLISNVIGQILMFKLLTNSYLKLIFLSGAYAFAIIILIGISCITDLSSCEISTNIKLAEAIIPLLVAFTIFFCMGVIVTSIILGINSYLKKLNHLLYMLLSILTGGISGLVPVIAWNIISSGIAFDIFYVSTENIICFLSGATVSLWFLIIQNKNSALVKCV